MEGLLSVVADRLCLGAIAGAGQSTAPPGGGSRSAGVEAVWQPEECGAAPAGQSPLRGVGGVLVRCPRGGGVADQAGQFVAGGRVGSGSPEVLPLCSSGTAVPRTSSR